MKKIRVTHVITGLGVGGAELMLLKLLTQRNRDAIDAEVISLTDIGIIGEKIQGLEVPVRALHMGKGWGTIRSLCRLAQCLYVSRPDIVQTWMYHANLVGGICARLAGVPAVLWGIRASTLERGSLSRSTIWIAKLCGALSRCLPTRIISCSARGQETHIALGYVAGKMDLIPNGIDVDKFRPCLQARSSVRTELDVPPSTPLIGLVARFDAYKDHQTFLQAAALVHAADPKVHFLLCGKDVTWENARLASWIEGLGLRACCHLLGLRQDLPRLSAGLDLAVSSSVSEAWPNSIAEAMACAVPCVVTDVGDSAFIVGDTGRVVPAQDAAALAAAWLELLQMEPAARCRLGHAARQRVQQHFDITTITSRYEALYANVLAARAPASGSLLRRAEPIGDSCALPRDRRAA